MTKLTTLRSQLTGLRRARATVRSLTAWSAAGVALLWTLVAVFVLDYSFELGKAPRVALLLIAAGVVAWAAYRFTRPLLGVRETDEDMALMVERQQEIDSDLVAALQFESPVAATWGSLQLEHAVIEYVANVGRGLNVFEGFNRDQMVRRATILGITAGVLLLAAAIFPSYAGAFINRMMLGGMHYPTKTHIDAIVVNQTPVLVRSEQGSAPMDVKCAQGRPISFLIQCTGAIPTEGEIRLVSTDATRSKTTLDVTPLTLDQRLARLTAGEKLLRDSIKAADFAVTPAWKSEALAWVRLDAPMVADQIDAAASTDAVAKAADDLTTAIAAWPGDRADTTIFAGELSRLIDPVHYQLYLGDAWTDPATIAMTPLPTVEPRIVVTPPAYASTAAKPTEVGTRQLSVLEGSSVQLAVECTNGKQLASAWMILRRQDESKRYDLVKADDVGERWSLPDSADSPLNRVNEELRYEIQVQDADQLSLEAPIRGAIRIKPDRPPTGSAEVVHRVVLPTAEPVIHFRASDDFGLSKLNLLVEIEKSREDGATKSDPFGAEAAAADDADNSSAIDSGAKATTAAELHTLPLLPNKSLRGIALPVQGKYSLKLSPLGLSKGDRAKITLEVTDYRGEDAQGKSLGQTFLSDPLILEISDESGVLAAISEADEHSEQRLTDLIKRQLGIGESP